MKNYYRTPGITIAEYVQDMLVIENYKISAPFLMPLYANGAPTLLFQSCKATLQNKRTSHLTLFGQTVAPDLITLEGDFTLIAYFFKPYVLYTLFDLEAKELTDRPIDLGLLFPTQSRELAEQMLNASSTEMMLLALDQFIEKLIVRQKKIESALSYAALQINSKHVQISLPDLQKELCITERTFQRMFENKIGVPPATYKRVCQFDAAFQRLRKRQFDKLSDLAYDHGYADQSHYIRTFKAFTGITPKEYLNYPDD